VYARVIRSWGAIGVRTILGRTIQHRTIKRVCVHDSAGRRYVTGVSLTGSVFSWLMNADSAYTGFPASSIAG
jgi:hypothetical protein